MKYLLSLLGVVAVCVTSSVSVQAEPFPLAAARSQTLEQDSLALVALYNATDGLNWANNTNWLTGPLASWYGVTITDDRVTELDLSNNLLRHALPTEIGDLEMLERLDLSDNLLVGLIPSSLGNLENLIVLNLSENTFTSLIPSSLGNLTKLEELYLNENALLEDVPASFADLDMLRIVWLYENELSGLPDLSDAPLTSVKLEDNHFTYGDLEPYLGVAEFTFDPQREVVGNPQEFSVTEDETLLLHVDIGGSNTVYTWTKNGTTIPGATSETYTIDEARASDAGVYVLMATNDDFEDLDLRSAPITVTVTDINELPTIAITQGPTGTVGTTPVTFTWRGTDTDGTIDDYEWKLVSEEDSTSQVTNDTTRTFFNLDETEYTFSVRAIDDRGGISDWAMRTFTVDASVNVPVANDDTATTPEDTIVEIDVLANDTGTGPLSLIAVSDPEHGAALIDDNVIQYFPGENYFGTDTFTYTVENAEARTAQATVTVTITPVNDAPIFTSEPITEATEGVEYIYVIDTEDVENQSITLSASTLPDWLTFTPQQTSLATLTGTPTQEDVGTHPVVISATDGSATSQQSFTITVADVNSPPTGAVITSPPSGSDVLIEGEPDQLLVITWNEGSDPEGNPLTYTWQLSLNQNFEHVLIDDNVGSTLETSIDYGALGTLLTAQGVATGSTVTLYHRVLTSDGDLEVEGPVATMATTRSTLTDTEALEVPEAFSLEGNYPNPFNPVTTVRFDLPEASEVTIRLYDLLGREVQQWRAGLLGAGAQREVRLEVADMPSGTYVYRVEARGASGEMHRGVGRMTLVK